MNKSLSWRRQFMTDARLAEQNNIQQIHDLSSYVLSQLIFRLGFGLNSAWVLRRLTLLRSKADMLNFVRTAPREEFEMPSVEQPCHSPRKRLLMMATKLYQTTAYQIVGALRDYRGGACSLGVVLDTVTEHADAPNEDTTWGADCGALVDDNDDRRLSFVQCADSRVRLAQQKAVQL